MSTQNINSFTKEQHTHIELEHNRRFNVQIEGPTCESITDPIGMHTLSLYGHSDNPRTTEPLPGLHKHWMSRRQQHIYMSLIFFAIGFSAITALAVAIFGWLPLDIVAYLLVWPSIIIWLIIGVLYPDYGKLALKGFIIGLLACLFYDSMRFVSIMLGLWGDFIPKIGMWLLHTDQPDWILGYIWRYVGDGGFMSVTFVVSYRLLNPKLDVRIAALAFGIAIWLCLVATILFSPHGTRMLFPLTPITFSLSLLGHIIYGLSIGFLYPVFIGKNTHGNQKQVSRSSSDIPFISSLPQTYQSRSLPALRLPQIQESQPISVPSLPQTYKSEPSPVLSLAQVYKSQLLPALRLPLAHEKDVRTFKHYRVES